MAPIPAGTWHLVGDGEGIRNSVTVRFDVLWRPQPGTGETVIATVTHTFVPDANPNPYASVMFDANLSGIAVDAVPGDLITLRFSTLEAAGYYGYIPNGDGAVAGARVPNLTLPRP